MPETQESISKWATETFGVSSSNARVAARANEEMAELLRALTADDDSPKAAEEAADVKIVLYRLAERMGFRLESGGVLLSMPSNYSVAVGANEYMARVLSTIVQDEETATYAIQATVRWLHMLAARMGFQLNEEVDKKMAVNRARVWNLDGSGHGYHVRDKAAV